MKKTEVKKIFFVEKEDGEMGNGETFPCGKETLVLQLEDGREIEMGNFLYGPAWWTGFTEIK